MKLLIHACPALFALWGAFCLGNACMAQTIAAPSSNDVIITEQLVEAIIQVESQGDPQRVGSMGERGLMQIRLATWREMTREIYGRPQPFQKAFEPALNRRVGRAYLTHLQDLITPHRDHWQTTDERALLIAAYNAGPTLLAQKNFDLQKMPASTRDYVERVTNLHEALLAELARIAQQREAAKQQLAQRYISLRVASI